MLLSAESKGEEGWIGDCTALPGERLSSVEPHGGEAGRPEAWEWGWVELTLLPT